MWTLILLALVAVTGIAQEFRVEGAVLTPLRLTPKELGRMARTSATLTHDGRSVMYEGVLLQDVLHLAGLGELRGQALANFVMAEATDGYRVVFSLAELDGQFGDEPVLVADHAAGEPLKELRLVVPRDKRAARSVRMLVKLAVMAPAR